MLLCADIQFQRNSSHTFRIGLVLVIWKYSMLAQETMDYSKPYLKSLDFTLILCGDVEMESRGKHENQSLRSHWERVRLH